MLFKCSVLLAGFAEVGDGDAAHGLVDSGALG
jgi:hypothetical protein